PHREDQVIDSVSARITYTKTNIKHWPPPHTPAHTHTPVHKETPTHTNSCHQKDLNPKYIHKSKLHPTHTHTTKSDPQTHKIPCGTHTHTHTHTPPTHTPKHMKSPLTHTAPPHA